MRISVDIRTNAINININIDIRTDQTILYRNGYSLNDN